VEKGTKQSRKIGLGFMGYLDMIEKTKTTSRLKRSFEAFR
jgi:hypothetical protein